MKRLVVILLTTVLGAVGIVIGASKTDRNTAGPRITGNSVQQDGPNTIDGAKNPELIPDRIAYTLLLRLIANRQTEQEKESIRAYIRQMGIGKPCCGQRPSMGTSEEDIDALIAAAEEFHQRVGALDHQVKEIKDKKRLDPNVDGKDQLKKLQKQKEKIVDEIMASLPRRLSKKGVEKLRQQVNEQFKRKVKYTPSSDSQ